MLFSIIHYVFPILCLATAFVFGGWPERCAGAIMLIGSLASALVAVNTWTAIETDTFWIDSAALASLWTIALTSNRFWPYYVTAFQLLTVYCHLQAVVFNDPLSWAYGILNIYASFPIFLIIGLASIFVSPQSNSQ
jgi:hypothetical protein